MELFKQLTINIPFADALAQMPSYAKFMKEILTHKRKIFTDEPEILSTRCSAILQGKLPIKKKDPGSITIPCILGDYPIEKSLCDSGAGINLMPL